MNSYSLEIKSLFTARNFFVQKSSFFSSSLFIFYFGFCSFVILKIFRGIISPFRQAYIGLQNSYCTVVKARFSSGSKWNNIYKYRYSVLDAKCVSLLKKAWIIIIRFTKHHQTEKLKQESLHSRNFHEIINTLRREAEMMSRSGTSATVSQQFSGKEIS